MNFRNKLLFTIIPIVVLAVGALAVTSWRIASESVVTEQRKNMEQIVQRVATELGTWVSARERDAVLFSENGVFQSVCQGQRIEEAQSSMNELTISMTEISDASEAIQKDHKDHRRNSLSDQPACPECGR